MFCAFSSPREKTGKLGKDLIWKVDVWPGKVAVTDSRVACLMKMMASKGREDLRLDHQ